MPHKTGIYCLLNLINKKVYVGSAAFSLDQRRRDHYSCLRRGIHYSKHLQAAWNKYGEDNFKFIVLQLCDPEDCLKLEQVWMDRKRAINPLYGYNLRPRAESNRGITYSEEAKKKISIANSGKSKPWLAEWNRTRVFSPEMRKAMSDRCRGRVASEETRRKISAAGIGRKHSTATKIKMSRSMKGLKRTEEGKANMSLAAKKREHEKRLVKVLLSMGKAVN